MAEQLTYLVEIPIVRDKNLDLPSFATRGSSGVDLRYCGENRVLRPMERGLFTTGIHITLPRGHVGLVCPRSGLALNQGITVLNAPGIIDNDYTGEIGVILINLSDEDVTISNGDRIAQLVISTCKEPIFYDVDSLKESERGDGSFGHTGIN